MRKMFVTLAFLMGSVFMANAQEAPKQVEPTKVEKKCCKKDGKTEKKESCQKTDNKKACCKKDGKQTEKASCSKDSKKAETKKACCKKK